MKEMTSVATTMMTEEEKAEMERELNEGRGPSSSSPSTPPHGVMPTPSPGAATHNGTASPPRKSTEAASGAAHDGALTPSPATTPGEGGDQKHLASSSASAHKEKDKKKPKITPEQKKKLQELEEERRKNMEQRIESLTAKLVDRLRPFVHAKHPGDKDDPETRQFEAKIRQEADDLKLESFGVEVSDR